MISSRSGKRNSALLAYSSADSMEVGYFFSARDLRRRASSLALPSALDFAFASAADAIDARFRDGDERENCGAWVPGKR